MEATRRMGEKVGKIRQVMAGVGMVAGRVTRGEKTHQVTVVGRVTAAIINHPKNKPA